MAHGGIERIREQLFSKICMEKEKWDTQLKGFQKTILLYENELLFLKTLNLRLKL